MCECNTCSRVNFKFGDKVKARGFSGEDYFIGYVAKVTERKSSRNLITICNGNITNDYDESLVEPDFNHCQKMVKTIFCCPLRSR